MSRTLPALFLFLLVAPAASAADDGGRADDGFSGTMLDSPDSWTVQVSKRGAMSITIGVHSGSYEDLVLSGPGRCKDVNLGAGTVLRGDPPLTFTVECGQLPHGRYPIEVGVGFGFAQGNLNVRGARMAD